MANEQTKTGGKFSPESLRETKNNIIWSMDGLKPGTKDWDRYNGYLKYVEERLAVQSDTATECLASSPKAKSIAFIASSLAVLKKDAALKKEAGTEEEDWVAVDKDEADYVLV